MITRYNRHNLIDWFSQESLAKRKIAIIGAGAVGNEVIKNLSLLGIGELHIFDFDNIEEHNLTRSVLFRDSDVGSPKAKIAAQRAMELDPNVSAYPVFGDFWDSLAISDLKTFDTLFCCVDNYEARIKCNTMCYIAKVDLVNIGIDSRSALVETYPFSESIQSGCIECSLPETVYRRISERYSCGHLRRISFIEKKVPTTIITSSIAASFAVSVGLRLGSSTEVGAFPKRLYLDTIAGNLTKTALVKRGDCPCCGRIPDGATLMRTKRSVHKLPSHLGVDATVVTSEQVLVSYRIAGDEQEHIVFRKASEFDETFPATLTSDPGSVELEVRDQFTLSEISERFSGLEIPSKFAIVSTGQQTLVCEFEGGSYE